MPRGFQWSLEDIRNAERAAKIQAEALVKSQREAQERAERQAEKRANRYTPSTPYTKPKPNYSGRSNLRPSSLAGLSMEEYMEVVYTNRTRRVKENPPGSPNYMDARYTPWNWNKIRQKVMDELGCDKATAEQHILETFDENLYREYEDERMERKLGNR